MAVGATPKADFAPTNSPVPVDQPSPVDVGETYVPSGS